MSRGEGSFGRSISILNRVAGGYFQKKLKPYGLGPGQQAYLLALLPGEEIIQEQLSLRLKVDRANVTRAVKGLEFLGYIKRTRSDEDKRLWMVSLTVKGFEVRTEVENIARKWLETLKSSVTSEQWSITEECLKVMAEFVTEK